MIEEIENRAGAGIYDLPVGSSDVPLAPHFEVNNEDISDIRRQIPSKGKTSYDIKYMQENFDTCGISALSSALHSLVSEEFGRAIITQKQTYLDAHKKQKFNTKNNEMKMLIQACNDLRGKYKVNSSAQNSKITYLKLGYFKV